MYTIPTMMKKKRTELKMNRIDFADYIAVNRNTIDDWENGVYVPREELRPVIAKLLGIPLDDVQRMCERERERRQIQKKKGSIVC